MLYCMMILSSHNVNNCFNCLYQIKERKYKYPHQIYKVPVESHLLNHEVTTPALERVCQCHTKDNDVQQDPDGHVEAMETGDGEEKVSKLQCRDFRDVFREIRRQRNLRRNTLLRRDASPPEASVVQVGPLQRLATDEHQTTDNGSDHPTYHLFLGIARSEERRVGKECTSRWCPDP